LIDVNDITIISGPAGSAKTWSACYYAVQCLKSNKFDNIIFTKPIREAGEQLGFLPGDIKDKIDPHYESFRQNILKMIDKQTLQKNYERGVFIDKPLAYLRGQSFDNALLILDEAQNCDIRDLMMFVTRMGKNSKVIICGDISQHDIKLETVAIPYFEKLIGDIPGVTTFKFDEDDIMRNGILKEITRRYEREKAEGKIPKMKKI